MKKTLLSLLTLISLLTAAQAQIVINEIMYNPPESGTDSLEYIELFNNGNTAVDVSGWSLVGVNFSYPAGSSIPAKGYSVSAINANAFKNVFGFTPLQWGPMSALNNGGEVLRVLDANGTEVDAVDYKNALPWPTEANGNGASIVLCDPTSDNSLPISWQACPTPANVTVNGKAVFANPNAASACSGSNKLVAVNDQGIANRSNTLIINVLSNDLLPNPVLSIALSAAAKHGTATVNTDKTIQYQADQGYCGRDTFFYQVCDNALCDTARVVVTVRCYENYSIQQATANDTVGIPLLNQQIVELRGTVYGFNLRPLTGTIPTTLFTIIDENGFGISVGSTTTNCGYTVTERDNVTVFGTIGHTSGLATLTPDFITKNSSDNSLLTPTVVTKLSEATESKLIRINNLRLVDPAQWTNGLPTISGFTANAVSDDHPLDTIAIRIDRDVENFNTPAPTVPFHLIGIGGQFDSNSPFTSGYQILPRYNPDIFPITSTHQADFSANVRLTPNPASEALLITTDLAFDRVRIIAPNGTLVQTLENPAFNTSLPVRNLPAGTYFARFEKDGAVWTTQFVKI